MKIDFSKYSTVIANRQLGDAIYDDLRQRLKEFDVIDLDFAHVNVMTTFCAKQIFGRLYTDFGAEIFYNRLRFHNVSDDLRLIIEQGIQNAVEKTLQANTAAQKVSLVH